MPTGDTLSDVPGMWTGSIFDLRASAWSAMVLFLSSVRAP
jgi:hypothetical protein